MIKYIKQVMYDTERSKVLGHYNTSTGKYEDSKWVEEILYITKKGEFFLVASGGADSKYGEKMSDIVSKGNFDIFSSMTLDEARNWLQDYCVSNIGVVKNKELVRELFPEIWGML